MANTKRSSGPSLQVKAHPSPELRERIQLLRYRRSATSRVWEARFLIAGVWSLPVSLREEDETKASWRAAAELTRREALHGLGAVPCKGRVVHAFGEVAAEVADLLEKQALETSRLQGQGKAQKFAAPARTIRNILIPEWEHTPVEEMTSLRLNDWMRDFRVGRGSGVEQRKASQNYVGNINDALRKVLLRAVEKGWIRDDQRGTMSKKGFAPPERNAAFSTAEVSRLNSGLSDVWIEDAHKGVSRELRRALRAYAALVASSGIRPGVEVEHLEIGQIVFERRGGDDLIRVPVRPDQSKVGKFRNSYCNLDCAFPVREILENISVGCAPKEAGPATSCLACRPPARSRSSPTSSGISSTFAI